MKLDYVWSAALISLVGCGTTEAPDEGSSAPVPMVLAHEPADHAVGVRADAQITLSFSEPMDSASVEAALSAPHIGAATFIWNLSNTEVKIVPEAAFPYAEGTGNDPTTVEPLTFEVVLAPSAVSKQGVPLPEATAFMFSTLKRLETTAPVVNDLTMHVYASGQLALANTDLRVGDGVANSITRGLITFNLSDLTDRAVEIESAHFTAIKTDVVGEPFSINPSIMSYHVSFTDPAVGYSVDPLDAMGTFADVNTAGAKQDVTAQLNDDLAHRTERQQHSQFRLQFDGGTDGDGGQDFAVFGRAQLGLAFTYLAP